MRNKIQIGNELSELSEEIEGVQNVAADENRDLTDYESKRLAGLRVQLASLEDELSHCSQGRRADLQYPGVGPFGRPMAFGGASRRSGGVSLPGDRGGFASLGEFAATVREAAKVHKGGSIDQRLIRNQSSTYSSEGAGEDGGFAVPPDFRAGIWMHINGEQSLLGRTDQTPTKSNNIEMPTDQAPPWDTSSGPQVSWDGEGDKISPSKIKLKSKTIRLNKIDCLVPVTDELVEDAPALDGYLRRIVGQRIDFAISLSIVQGPGAGKPLGILTSPSLLSIPRETLDEITFGDLKNLIGNLYAPLFPRSVFLVHPKVIPALMDIHFPLVEYGTPNNQAVAPTPVYLPNGGIAGAPFGTLMGRPLIPTEACEPVGDKGDIILVDLSQFWTATKSTGLRTDVSIHLWFDYGILAYRFILRFTGSPHWAAPITGRDGISQYSWAVCLSEEVES
jgi:HK97 family phage major capsid protein